MNPSLKTTSSVLKRHRAALMVGALALGGAYFAGQSAVFSAGKAIAQSAETATTVPSFRPIVQKVSPAVVSIRVKSKARPQASSFQGFEDLPKGHPLERFFRDFGKGTPGLQGRPEGNRPGNQFSRGQGSGFFVSGDGYVVTNNHVIDNAEEVDVILGDGETYKARVIGHDDKTDLALLKVDADREFPHVSWSDNDVYVGDWVVAVGNPFGLGGTVTAGIVSARGREIGSGPYDDFIQIDAPINRGNSGGPTFDLSGNVVGVNTAIFSPSGGSVGIGFAIPASTAQDIIEDLKDDGRIVRGWLGVQIQNITEDLADSLGLESRKGALVSEPQEKGPAIGAGIKAGDTIVAVNGDEIRSPRHLARTIAGIDPETEITVTVWRDGQKQDIQVTLGRLPGAEQQASLEKGSTTLDEAAAKLGMALAPAAEVGADQGVAIVKVEPGSKAAEKGIRSGDLILSMGGETVTSADDIKKGMDAAKADGRKAVLFQLKTQQGVRFVALPLEKA